MTNPLPERSKIQKNLRTRQQTITITLDTVKLKHKNHELIQRIGGLA